MKYEVPKSGNDKAGREDEEGKDNVDGVFKNTKKPRQKMFVPQSL